MTPPAPRAVLIGPRKLYDFFANKAHATSKWEFVGHAESVSDFWDGTAIEDKNDPRYIDGNFQVVIAIDTLYNPEDQAIRATGEHEDNSLETLIVTLCQNDSVLVLVPQFKPDKEAHLRAAIRSSAQQYDMDANVKYWFVPKRGINRAIDSAVAEYISSSSDRHTASILAGEDLSQDKPGDEVGDEVYSIREETNIGSDFVDEGRMGRVVAVTSSKGGSGKSTMAVLLATYLGHASEASVRQGLEERPLKVCLVDLDTRDSQLGFFLGTLRPNVSQIVAQGITRKNIQETVIHSSRLKIDVLLGPRRPRYAAQIKPTFYRDLIGALRKEYDFIILDTSVSYLDPLLEKVAYPLADLIVLVSDIGANSIYGMTRWIQEVTWPIEKNGSGISKNKIGIVVNRSIADVNMPPEVIKKACLGLPIISLIPNNAKLVVHALNIHSMEKVLLHKVMRKTIGKIAYSVLGDKYKLATDFDLNSD